MAIKSLDILGKEFTVEWLKGMAAADEAYGKCKPDQCWIHIELEQPLVQRQDTLLHEVLHAIWAEMGLTEGETKEHEETVVRRLATGLLYVLRQNPEFADYLHE